MKVQLSCGLLVASMSGMGASLPAYELTILDLPDGFNYHGCAYAIGDDGTIAGEYNAPSGNVRGFVHVAGKSVDLGTLGGGYTWARAVNGRGLVVGSSATSGGEWHPYSYRTSKGRMRNLYPEPGFQVYGRGVNDRGVVVGGIRSGLGEFEAYVLDDGVLTRLGTLGGTSSMAEAINNGGAIVGMSTLPSGDHRPFLVEHGVMKDLGSFGGAYGSAMAINAKGVVTGWSEIAGTEENRERAFVYKGDSLKLLEGWQPGMTCFGLGINDLNEVVGTCAGPGIGGAVIWRGGKARELSKLIKATTSNAWQLNEAHGVNGSGQIVGCAWNLVGGVQLPFLLTPVN